MAEKGKRDREKKIKDTVRSRVKQLAAEVINETNYPNEDVQHAREYVTKNMDRYLDTLSMIPRFYEGSDRKILDIGIAYGFHDVVLKEIGYTIIGTEQESRIPKHCYLPLREGIDIRELDVTKTDMPFDDGTFDIILFGEVLEHVRDSPVRTIKQVARLLKPNGHLIFTTPNFCRITNIGMLLFKNNPLEPFEYDFNSETADGHITDSWTHIREFTAQELKEIVELAGMEVVDIKMSMCWDTYAFNYNYGGFSKGKKSISFILFLLNKLFKTYRSDIMVLAQKKV